MSDTLIISIAIGIILLTPITSRLCFSFLDWCVINIPNYEKCKNPLVKDTNKNRYNEFLCRKNGCITKASYYIGMPQSICKRCGHRNKCAASHVKEWNKID
jgi:hypothetical protein